MSGANLPALELGGLTLGLREGVIALIVLVTIYMLFVLLRMLYLRNKSVEQPEQPVETIPPVLKKPLPDDDEPELTLEESWAKPPPRMADDLLRQGLEQELAQLREEVDAIRGELAALRADMLQELAHMRATQSVSPIYGDAMQMAASGYEPAMIAERCGIARAEAELVVALAKSQAQ